MRRPLHLLLRAYKLTLSPLLMLLGGPRAGCRFQPTCSEYFVEALDRHGIARGTWLGLKRLGRCHPWGGEGYDPVPGDAGREMAPPNQADVTRPCV